MTGLSTRYEKSVLSHIFCPDIMGTTMSRPGSIVMSLHYADPTDAGIDDSEFVGGSYSRKTVTFDLPQEDEDTGDVFVLNNNAVTFSSLPALTLNYIAFWDDSGNMITAGELVTQDATPTTSLVLSSGDNVTFPSGTLKVVLD